MGENNLGQVLSGTWTDLGDGNIKLEWSAGFIWATVTGEFSLSGGGSLDTATTLAGTQSLLVLGYEEVVTTDGFRTFPE